MKKFYYFSEKSLKFLEIKHFKAKLITYFTTSVIISISIILGVIYLISSLSNDPNKIQSLKSENQILKEKLATVSNNYQNLESELKNLTEFSKELRLAANLEPISDQERLLGTGGSKSIDNLFTGVTPDVEKTLEIVDKVSKEFEFEKSEFEDISNKLKRNNDLYTSVPAILPTNGEYSTQSFGMRLHPILKVWRMHNGIDIVTNVGTPVKATGKGKVVFVGYRNDYGLAVEIDHGFGYRTIYGHLSKSKVKEGQIVKRGEVIARTGNSGLSTGPHLHYEVLHDGKNINPAEFFFDEFSYFESTSSK
jgi:murein DD-endopeptidase MepM/ murein hydrolase activator NlpD